MSDSAKNRKAENAGRLVILSGPSGVGKSTCVKRLLETCKLPLELSVSATTRPKRPGEIDGHHYNFVSEEEFGRLQSEGAFLETTEVFGVGHQYGTLLEPVSTGLKAGKWIILEIDVIGAAKVIADYPDAISIFIYQELDEIEARLRGRKTETEEAIKRRLEVASSELEVRDLYQHQVVNEKVDTTAEKICRILNDSCSSCQPESKSNAEN